MSVSHESDSPSSLTATRRLSDDDVRSIFESLHHSIPAPCHLKFKIIPVGPNGLKLSPPAYEFEDGLYVLLRPMKKRKSGTIMDQPMAPSHLAHLVVHEPQAETCPWSLSGPQFPQPTAIQQRYCYPKGRPDYSCRKGGALWTMYGADGKEDVEYRLLHVYYSAKRAINKGFLDDHSSSFSTPSKRSRKMEAYSPPRSIYHLPRTINYMMSPKITSSSSSTTQQSSPPSYDMAMPSRFSNYVTPGPPETPGARSGTFYDTCMSTRAGSPFRPKHSFHDSSILQSPLQRPSSRETEDSFDLGNPWHELDAHWEDPMISLLLKSAHEGILSLSSSQSTDDESNESTSFAQNLQIIRKSLQARVKAAPENQQASLIAELQTWANHLAHDPFGHSLPLGGDSASSFDCDFDERKLNRVFSEEVTP